MTIQGAEWVELYNSSPAPKNVSGWKIREGAEQQLIPGGTVIPGHGYTAISLTGIMNDVGGEVVLIDLQQERQDGVFYGQVGSAPLPPSTALAAAPTLARAPDVSTLGTVPLSDPDTDGAFWTIDNTATLGALNNAPTPLLGTSLLINEVHSIVGGGDAVELYNPTNVTIPLAGWALCNGLEFMGLAGGVPGHGFTVITTGPTFDVDDLDLLYLFDAGGVRRDQLGWTGGPFDPPTPESANLCLGRFHDGDGPSLGYDWISSGGGTTFLVLGCTLGGQNGGTAGVPDRRIITVSFGRMKASRAR